MEQKLGLVGLGAIGQLYAGHLLRDWQAGVYHRVPERVKQAEAQGAVGAESAQELGAQSEMIVLALPSPDAVEHAMLDNDGVLASAGVKKRDAGLDVSTIDPPTSVKVYQAAKDARRELSRCAR